MRSFRSRLILGVSLIAVLPLAVALMLFSRRVHETVRTESEERLAGVLGLLEDRLRVDEEHMRERVRHLATDTRLIRLHLLRPATRDELAWYLEQQRARLGFDSLAVVDSADTAGFALEPLPAGRGMTLFASAAIFHQGTASGFVRGGMRLDASFLEGLKRASGLDLVLRDGAGRTVTSTLDPDAEPFVPLMEDPAAAGLGRRPYWSRSFAIPFTRPPMGRIVGLVATAAADQTVTSLQLAAVLLGLLGLAMAVTLGLIWSRQIARPVEALAAHSERIARGEWDEPLAIESVREMQSLVTALERMRGDLSTYRARLAASERHAAWSEMARTVAHEIKNPLTPIAVSVADLARSYEQRRPDFPQILAQAVQTIGEEVQTLKRLLQEFTEFGRLPPPAFAPCRTGDLLSDIAALYGHDVSDGRLAVSSDGVQLNFEADAAQVRQALVNLVKNALEAVPKDGRVTLGSSGRGDVVEFVVSDNGPGLTPDQKARVFAPDFTTKPGGSGLGLTIVERIVREHDGDIVVESEAGKGTTFRLRFPRERKP